MTKYKSIIVINRTASIEEDLDYIDKNIDEYGNVFYVMRTQYDSNNNVIIDVFDIMNNFLRKKFFYKNIITFPLKNEQNVSFSDNVGYILWISKSNKNIHFNKDLIRENHIWKDIEWGKRSKNYHKKGKDPGNVWIPTEDDGKGKISKHIILTEEEIIKRILDMSSLTIEETRIIGEIENLNTNIKKEEINFLKEPIEENTKKLKKENYVYFGSSENLSVLQNHSIKHAVTSPPYWDLKDYFKEGQIGQESYEKYLDRLKNVFNETYEKLDSNGSFWLNINLRRKQGKVTLNPKDIINLFKKIGYYYKGIIIWHKSSGIPSGDSNLVDRFEYMFLFSKNEDYTVNYNQFLSIKDYQNENLNGKAFWNINRKAGSVGKGYEHPAIYPNRLVERSILCNSNENDYIFDPFLGSGTSLIATHNMKRNFIGFEYNEVFKELIEHRMEREVPETLDNTYFIYL